MVAHKICFNGEIWLISLKLFLSRALDASNDRNFYAKYSRSKKYSHETPKARYGLIELMSGQAHWSKKGFKCETPKTLRFIKANHGKKTSLFLSIFLTAT